MVQSPSWEANWFAASQEIPCISRNPKVHYLTNKRPPTVSILGQPNPVHIPTTNLLEIHPNIVHPSTPRSSQWSLSLQFPHQDPIHPPLLNHTRHMPSPSQIKYKITKPYKYKISFVSTENKFGFLQCYLLYWRYICFVVEALSTLSSLLSSIEVYPFQNFLTFVTGYNCYVLKMWFLSLVGHLSDNNVCCWSF